MDAESPYEGCMRRPTGGRGCRSPVAEFPGGEETGGTCTHKATGTTGSLGTTAATETVAVRFAAPL